MNRIHTLVALALILVAGRASAIVNISRASNIDGTAIAPATVTVAENPIILTGSSGYVTSASSVNASAFFGNGANLTGIPSTASISGSYVPYTGATSNVTLGNSNLTSSYGLSAATGTFTSTVAVSGGAVTVNRSNGMQALLYGWAGIYNTNSANNGWMRWGNHPSRYGEAGYDESGPTDASVYLRNTYDNLASSIELQVRAGGSSQKGITLRGSGNVGISTASPNATLDVNGSAAFGSGATKSTFSTTGALTHNGDLTLTAGNLTVDNNKGIATVANADMIIQTASNGRLIYLRTGTGGAINLNDNGNASSAVGIGDATPDAEFEIKSARAATDYVLAISSQNDVTANMVSVLGNGNVGVGIAAPAALLDVSGGSLTVHGSNARMGTTGELDQGLVLSCTLGLTTTSTGAITGCVASDRRLKKNIVSMIYRDSLIEGLRPRKYAWKDEGRGKGRKAGFIAQEVEAVFPEAVVGGGTNLKAVDPNAILAALVLEVQQLRKRVAVLEARNAR